MKIKNIGLLAIALGGMLAAPAAHSQTEQFSAKLSGFREVPPISTPAAGSFEMTNESGAITFSLTFSGLSSAVTAAHIHFAPKKVNGGVMVFLCGGGGQPDCPPVTDGTITGTITSANVTGPTTQGVDVGDLDAALEAIGLGLSYVNVHTTIFPSGELRGQVRMKSGEAAK